MFQSSSRLKVQKGAQVSKLNKGLLFASKQLNINVSRSAVPKLNLRGTQKPKVLHVHVGCLTFK